MLGVSRGLSRFLNYIFTGIFIVEAVIRLIAMRFDYFKLGWNVFDFTIVVFSIVGEYCHCYFLEETPRTVFSRKEGFYGRLRDTYSSDQHLEFEY